MTARGIAIASSTGSLLAVAAAALLLLPSGNAATTALPSGNLVKNPGGETPFGSDTPDNTVRPAAWQPLPNTVPNRPPGEDPAAHVVRYGTHQFVLPVAVSKAIGGGRNFFAGKYGDEQRAGASQVIDVSGAASDIDAGGVKACLSAYLGGNVLGDSTAQAYLQFLGEDEAERGRLTLAPVTKGQRKGAATLLWRASERAVPPGTRTLTVWLNFARVGESWTHYAFADNVSVSLTKGRCIPKLAVRCQKGALLATVTPSDGVRTQRVRFQVKAAKGQKLVNDGRAPYSARVRMTGLTGRLAVSATLAQAGGGNVVLTKASRHC